LPKKEKEKKRRIAVLVYLLQNGVPLLVLLKVKKDEEIFVAGFNKI